MMDDRDDGKSDAESFQQKDNGFMNGDEKRGARGEEFNVKQKEQTWQEAVRGNPKALMWCSYTLFTCIMWGYDGLASSIVLAIPQFRQAYGQEFNGQFVVPAIWQLGLGGASLVGLLVGGMGAGVLSKRWGRQICMFVSYLFSIIGVFLQVFSSPNRKGNLHLLFGGKLLTGLPLGVFITIAPTYCSEIAPLPLRGAVTAAVNWSIVLGQCLAYVVMRFTQSIPSTLSFNLLFGMQWPFVLFALSFLYWFPESPYFLIERGRTEKARQNIKRIYGENFDVEGLVDSIEGEVESKGEMLRKASFGECFRGVNRVRTVLAMSAFFVQNVSGINWIIGYMAYFLELGGLSTESAFDATVVLSFIMLVGNMFSWVFVEKFGRRGTALYGSIVLTITLILIGITALLPSTNKSAIWAQVAIMAIWSFVYQSTTGSVAWPLSTEIPTTSLRTHTQALCTITSGLTGAVSGVLLPFAVNPDQGNMGGKVAFVYAVFMAGCVVGIWWWYPETKGLGFGEIDGLFEKWGRKEGGKVRHFGRRGVEVIAAAKSE